MTHVLLVEDEFLIRMVLSEALEDAGFGLSQADDADTAAALIGGGEDYDLLVTDIQMPGRFDGLDLGRLIRSRQPDIPIIYTTGRPDAMRALRQLGPQDLFIAKPYAPSEIVRAARLMLDPHNHDDGLFSRAGGYKQMCA